MPDTAYAFVSPAQPGGNIAEAAKRLRESEALIAHANTLPGVQRAHVALGVWNGGAEPSAVIHGLPGAIGGIAQALGEKYHQEAVLHFLPGKGDDTLHRLIVHDSPEKIHADLSSLGVSNKTIIPGRRPTVLLVDMGNENREKIAQYASSVGAEHTTEPGHAVLTTLRGPDAKLSRQWVTLPHDAAGLLHTLDQHSREAVNHPEPKTAGIHRHIADLLHAKLTKMGIPARHPSTYEKDTIQLD
jgi:hypothetical protein